MSAPRSAADLVARLKRVRLPGPKQAATERARGLLELYLQTAAQHQVPFAELVRQLASGMAALRIAGAELERQAADPDGPAARAACASGCAFCCILSGQDGGVISRAEAEQVHAALTPLGGSPDGRTWHPKACPALDPATRMCRIYNARPLICRTYLSDSAAACESNANGDPKPGAGVLGAQGLFLAALALCREMLKPIAKVETYALARLAHAALNGDDPADALKAARHKPRTLQDERGRLGGL